MLCGSAPLLCTTLVHLGELIPAVGCLSHSGKLTQDQEKKKLCGRNSIPAGVVI